LSHLIRQAAVFYKDNDRATEKSHTKGVSDKSRSKSAALLQSFATLKIKMDWIMANLFSDVE